MSRRRDDWLNTPPEERQRERFPFGCWPFRHMSMEAGSVLACAMNEAFLQSHDGILRVAPAAGAEANARFTLHAENGFVVSAEIRDGRPLWIAVRSTLGRTCRILRPWPAAHVFRNGEKLVRSREEILEFPTAEGDRFLLVPNEMTASEWETVPTRHKANKDARIHASGRAMLGLPRMF